MKKVILGSLVAALATAPSYARDRDYDGDVEYARVLSSTPIYRDVRIENPRQECRNERVVYQEPYRADPGAALLGAVLGGVIGHQIGHGRGNAIATGAGAVIGASYASQRAGYYGGGERVVDRPVCTTYNEYRTEQRIEGYDVAYRYNGRVYHTRTPYDPGREIAVRVDVAPVRYD